MSKKFEIRNSTVEFLIFLIDEKEDGVQVVYQDEYAEVNKNKNSKELLKESSSDKLIFVNIKNSYKAMLNNDRSNPMYRESLYECTRKYWSIADKKANAATHILGCYNGTVVEVISIKGFHIESSGEFAGRKVFEGIEQSESPYMGMDLYKIFDSLANFRVKYYNLRVVR